MKGHKWLKFAIFGLALLLILVACSPSESEQQEFPLGVYKSIGGRVLEFKIDGKFRFVEGRPLAEGDFSIDGQEITFGVVTIIAEILTTYVLLRQPIDGALKASR